MLGVEQRHTPPPVGICGASLVGTAGQVAHTSVDSWEVEIVDVVACDDVGVCLPDEGREAGHDFTLTPGEGVLGSLIRSSLNDRSST